MRDVLAGGWSWRNGADELRGAQPALVFHHF